MANLVIICGKSGSGKSTSGSNLDPKSTLWLNCDQKSLPLKGWKKNYSKENKNYAVSSSLVDIVNTLKVVPEKAKHIKTIVIDTINRVMTDKVMTAGKQLDKIVLESMSSVVLFTHIESDGKGKNEYFFQTQTDGVSTAKSPAGMFEDYQIPNDLKMVKDTMHKYYNE